MYDLYELRRLDIEDCIIQKASSEQWIFVDHISDLAIAIKAADDFWQKWGEARSVKVVNTETGCVEYLHWVEPVEEIPLPLEDISLEDLPLLWVIYNAECALRQKIREDLRKN